tara:strand:- start:209 stop:1732 length:1524 start_codon:yes stop_codon:yes gene_type:complete
MKNLQKKIQDVVNLYKSKKYSEAVALCKELIESNPKIGFLYNLMGIIMFELNRLDEAIDFYKKGIKVEPNFALIYSNLGNVYKSQNKIDEAEKNYKKAIDIDKKIPEPHNNLGNLLRTENKYEEAIKSYNKAIEINNNFFWAYYNLATTYTALGNYKKANEFLEKTIKINPFFCPAHRSLSRVKKYKINDKHLHEMQKIYKNKNINEIQKKELAFAIGKAYEDIGDYISSFEYYKEGNHLHRKLINFSIDDEKKDFDSIKEIYSFELLKKVEKNNKVTPKIIFIIGMPRSGTTLVEQIISSHPEVYGCDELNFIPDLYEKNINVNKLDQKILLDIGNEYISKINKVSNNSLVVTDKLPINFKWLGFIKLILPNSKIIHCIRNSKDNCFSIFKSFFPSKINFAFKIEEIVEFYNLYLELMEHWNKVIPNDIFNIRYENIIKNPDIEIKKIINACELKWNDQCLKFYNNKRPIKTSSDTQARSKIYSTSINSWEKYEKNLNKYLKKLKA